jgi:meso-butanediol dehydrogenase/(S,S)-butanediol dehydrogenase/diacetyl reductase
MNKPLKGKIALITGSSQGIGKAIALELGSLGATIALNGRNPAKLQKANEELQKSGITTLLVPGDITQYEVCEQIVSKIILNFEKLDILVTNASITAAGNFADLPIEIFKTAMDSQFYGSVFPVKAALPDIRRSKGSIILISSLAGLFGLPKHSAYSCGKMALTAFTQSLQTEERNSGMNIGIAYVGFTQNDSEKRVLNQAGEWCEVPQRPPALQQSPGKVARGIAGMILHRQQRKVFSAIGKTQNLIIRFTPWIFRIISKKF